MRLKRSDSWDCRHRHMGGWGESFGTIQVVCGTRERAVGVRVKMARNSVGDGWRLLRVWGLTRFSPWDFEDLSFGFRQVAFCCKACSVLLQSSLRFASRHAAFCLKTSCIVLQDPCVLSQDSCVLSHGGTAFCLLLKTLSGEVAHTTILSMVSEVFCTLFAFLFLEFEEVLRLLLVGSLSSLESDSDGGVTGDIFMGVSTVLCSGTAGESSVVGTAGTMTVPPLCSYCWVILCINPLYVNTASFGVNAAKEFKENMLSNYCSQAKLMLLINAAKCCQVKLRLLRVIEGILQPVSPTTAEPRLERKNELKAHGTLLMSLSDKHQLKFNTHKDAKTLIEVIEKRNKTDLDEQSLDDLFNSLKIYEVEVKSSSSASTSTQNIAFVSFSNTNSTNEPVTTAASVSAVSVKIPVSALPNIDADDLEEMDLKWKMAMLTRKGHFLRECRSPKDTRRNGAAEPQRRRLESVEARLLVYRQNESVFEEDIKLVKHEVQLRDNALVSLRQNLKNAEQERDDLKLKLEKFQTSSKNLSELLASQRNDKTGLGYNSQVFTRAMSDCNDYISSGSDASLPPSPIYDRYQSSNRYHAVPPPYTGTFMPPKHDMVFNNAPNYVKTDHPTLNFKLSPTKPDNDLSHTHQPSAPIIEDWVIDSEDESETKTSQNTAILKPTSNGKRKNRKACFVYNSLDHLIKDSVLTQSKLVLITAVRPVTTAVPNTSVTRPRQSQTYVTKPNSPPRRHINRSPSPKASTFPPKVTAVKAPMVNAAQGVQEKWEWKPKCLVLDHGNPQHVLKDKGVIYGGCSRHMTGNMSYLSDFEELNGGYVSFGGNPKGGMISGKGKIRTGKLDFDDVYFVKELKFNLFSVSQLCCKKNSVLFTDTECLVLSPEFKLPDENQVLLRVPRENNMYTVNLKNIVPSIDLTCLFAKATFDESNLWHRRLGHINFKTMNKLVKGNLVRGLPTKVFENDHTCVSCKKGKQHRASCKTNPVSSVNQPLQRLHMDLFGPTVVKSLKKKSYFLVVTDDYSRFTWVIFLATKDETSPILKTIITGLKNQLSLKVKNTDGDAAFDEKEHEFEGRKPESEVNVSSSSKFKDFSDNSINEDNAVGTLVPAVGQLSPNSTNTFSVSSPSNAAASLTQGKYSCIDTSKLPDDPNMSELEDITYFYDEDDVGAETDFNNLETFITVSPIPTRRVHKDHHVTQIIGDLSSAVQTRSMTRVAKDQGVLSQINNDDFYTCMFVCFLSQEEPKRAHQALKDPSWIEAMQEELF
nr:putative ribonuclease H-like domain-containing protein [Tanacetum cinerariifolium]